MDIINLTQHVATPEQASAFWLAGWNAQKTGQGAEACPYASASQAGQIWLTGYTTAWDAAWYEC